MNQTNKEKKRLFIYIWISFFVCLGCVLIHPSLFTLIGTGSGFVLGSVFTIYGFENELEKIGKKKEKKE